MPTSVANSILLSFLVLPSCIFAQLRTQLNEKCVRENVQSTVTCSSGIWPTDKDLDFSGPQIYILSFEDLEFNCDQVRPLPAAAITQQLGWLTFTRVKAVNNAGLPVSFSQCLKKLTTGRDFSTVGRLHFSDTFLSQLDDDVFKGFAGLGVLLMKNTSVGEISLDAFKPFTRLSTFELSGDQALTRFYFDRLQPAKETLKEFTLNRNSQLTTILLADNRPSFSFSILTKVFIGNNRRLTVFRDPALSLISSDIADIDFQENGAQCGSCHLQDLLKWDRAQEKRTMKTDCRRDCGLEGTFMSMGNRNWYVEGVWSTQHKPSWKPEDEPACRAGDSQLEIACSIAATRPYATTTPGNFGIRQVRTSQEILLILVGLLIMAP